MLPRSLRIRHDTHGRISEPSAGNVADGPGAVEDQARDLETAYVAPTEADCLRGNYGAKWTRILSQKTVMETGRLKVAEVAKGTAAKRALP